MIKFVKSYISKFIKDTQAVSVPALGMFAFAATSIVVTAVQVNQVVDIKAQLQAAADQATSSGMIEGAEADRVSRCESIFNKAMSTSAISQYIKNVTAGGAEGTTSGRLCEMTDVTNRDGDTVRALKLTASVKFQISSTETLGLAPFDVTVESYATKGSDRVEVVFALSTQGTMCATSSRNSRNASGQNNVAITPDPTCQKFELAKSGIQDAIAEIDEHYQGDALKVGLVPFATKVNFIDMPGGSGAIPPSIASEEDAGFYTADITNATDEDIIPAIVPLTSNLATFNQALNDIDIDIENQAWGRGDIAAHTSFLMLDPAESRFFPGLQPAAFDDTTVDKFVVMMFDGASIGCCFTNWPEGNFDNNYLYSYEPYNEHIRNACLALKSRGVKIFTVLLDVNINDPGGEVINNIMARCASGTYSGSEDPADRNALLECKRKENCLEVSSPREMKVAYKELVSQITKANIDR